MNTVNNRTIEIFEEINTIPRDSFKEKAVSDYIKAWAEKLGFNTYQDQDSNLLINKPAAPGYEDAMPVIIQAHMDMVCEKTPESTHDFDKDPIILRRDGDWIESAVGTSIGADNAIGVATAMRILEDKTLKHPPLEIVFTVREEVDFYGAEIFDGSKLKGRRFINLDFEVDDELIAGSCGGFGANFDMKIGRVRETSLVPYEVKFGGLIGGHSGEDIHNGRGNAIIMLARMIKASGYQVASIDAGTNRLAIPRDASAVIYAPVCDDALAFFEEQNKLIKHELGKTGANANITVKRLHGDAASSAMLPLDAESQSKLMAALFLYPNGPMELSGDFKWTVENSNNLGIIETALDEIKIVSEARGQHKTSFGFTEDKLKFLAEIVGAEVSFFTRYEPWEFKEESSFRDTATKTYKDLFGEDMRVLVLHAGLECSCFVSKFDELDVIAIGPVSENLHSPTERVSISSVEKHYTYITALLANLR